MHWFRSITQKKREGWVSLSSETFSQVVFYFDPFSNRQLWTSGSFPDSVHKGLSGVLPWQKPRAWVWAGGGIKGKVTRSLTLHLPSCLLPPPTKILRLWKGILPNHAFYNMFRIPEWVERNCHLIIQNGFWSQIPNMVSKVQECSSD